MSTATVKLTNLSPADSAPSLQMFEQIQQDHYREIAGEYEAHYSDCYSLEYRKRFIYEPMFHGIDIEGMNVLDAMCGSGQTTQYLVAKGARVTGLDISDVVVDSFRSQFSECKVVCRSLLDSQLPDESFDCVSVVGGLHHVQPNVSEAVTEIYRVLKPGGYFCFMEPHSGSIADLVRQFWYKHDRLFSDNERAIDIVELQNQFKSRFSINKTNYIGNVAFLLVLNSLVFRIPLRIKPLYSPVLLALEGAINKVQVKSTSCFLIAQWQKR